MGATAEAHYRPVGQNHFQSQHVTSRHPVFQAPGASGIGGDISAESGFLEAGGIGRVKKTLAGDRGGEFGGNHPGFHHGHPILFGNFKNAVHPDRGEDQTPADGDATADITPTPSAGGHGNPPAVAEGEDFGDLDGVTGKGHGLR